LAEYFLENNLALHEHHELRVLELIEAQDKLTQRGVAADLEIAIGMANSLIKRLVLKGYIKIKNVPSSRYGYYLTPQGFMAKSQLVSKYIANSAKFFGEVRCDLEAIAKQVSKSKYSSVGCVGTGEILEIAHMVFRLHNVKISFVVDILGHVENQHYKDLSEVPVSLMEEVDYLVITESERPHKAFEIISTSMCKKAILPPLFMKIMPKSDINKGAG
jgi:DNA-binding MarR family transcriptional regulator